MGIFGVVTMGYNVSTRADLISLEISKGNPSNSNRSFSIVRPHFFSFDRRSSEMFICSIVVAYFEREFRKCSFDI